MPGGYPASLQLRVLLGFLMGGLRAGEETRILYEARRARSAQTRKRVPNNTADYQISEIGAKIGSWFGVSGLEKAPTTPLDLLNDPRRPAGEELANVLRGEMCL